MSIFAAIIGTPVQVCFEIGKYIVLSKLTCEREEIVDGRNCYVIYLTASVSGLAYPNRRAWVDADYFLPIREELYAKSGQLLKSTSMKAIKRIGDRWFPTIFIFKDELKRFSKGTECIIEDIMFDIDIYSSIFLKSSLRK